MFVKSIVSVSKQNIVEKLQSAKFISLTMDGSTDFTGDDLELVFTLNFLPYRPTGPSKFKYLQAHHEFYRPEFETYIIDH
jgi:hypothetical protein